MGPNSLNIERLRAVANKKIKVNATNRRIARIKLAILSREKYKCRECGSTQNLTIDHIIPVREIVRARKSNAHHARWSPEYREHCQVLCFECHAKKNIAELKGWLKQASHEELEQKCLRIAHDCTRKGVPWPSVFPLPEWFAPRLKTDETGRVVGVSL